jgi:RNA polymerase sigma-70 factor (ECF subfamily)
VLLEHYRAKGRPSTSLDEVPEHSFVSPDVSGSALLEIREAQQIVRGILSDLPARDGQLLRSVLLEQRDKNEVCAELGLSREYLRVLVHRAKRSFKSLYLKRFGEAE